MIYSVRLGQDDYRQQTLGLFFLKMRLVITNLHLILYLGGAFLFSFELV